MTPQKCILGAHPAKVFTFSKMTLTSPNKRPNFVLMTPQSAHLCDEKSFLTFPRPKGYPPLFCLVSNFLKEVPMMTSADSLRLRSMEVNYSFSQENSPLSPLHSRTPSSVMTSADLLPMMTSATNFTNFPHHFPQKN